MSEAKYKSLSIFDRGNYRDQCAIKGTCITIYETHNGKAIFKSRGTNKVIYSGSESIASKLFDLSSYGKLTPSYNTILGLENSVVADPDATETKVYLFAVGTNGCGTEASQVYTIDTTKWIDSASLVPFRYCDTADDISDAQRSIYFGRKVTGTTAAYYFKKFESDPELVRKYADGTEIGNNVWADTKISEAECYVTLKLKVTPDECREFFEASTGINSAKVNTISLLEAWAKTIDGKVYYQDIRPITKYNFPNEYLIEPDKGLDITYQVYF